jgi:hypothetical protein
MKLLNNNSRNIDSVIGCFSIFIIGLYFLLISIYANIDLIEGRYAIYMDEQIIFDGVSSFLHSSNMGELVHHLIYGDLRYGRILYYVSAIFSFIPESIFGESGQIVATRLLQTIVLMSAYFLISFTFFRQWKTKILAFLLLLLMPSTLYYFTMPKPEPLQTLFVALFLWQANKHDFKLGWYWIFMGLAFGAKISVLPYILMFAILAMYQHNVEILSIQFWKKTIVKTISIFFIGFFIAEPILLTGQLQDYLNATFRNTTHGSDDTTITLFSWIEFIYTTLSPEFTFLLFVGSIFITIKIIFYKINFASLSPIKKENIGYFIFLFGFLMLLIIMLKVDRLWYFYLHLSFIFIIIGFLMFLDNFLLYKKLIVRVIAITLFGGLLSYSLVDALIVSKKYISKGQRTL